MARSERRFGFLVFWWRPLDDPSVSRLENQHDTLLRELAQRSSNDALAFPIQNTHLSNHRLCACSLAALRFTWGAGPFTAHHWKTI
jgi:hypothetical protein